MRSTIGIYDSHEKAVKAVEALKEAGYSIKQLSLMGQAGFVKDKLEHIDKREVLINAPLATGLIAGPILGLLAGIGLFAIPGVGVVFGSGAIVGALGGLDLGLIGGGLATVLTRLGMKDEKAKVYEEHLKDGKFMVIMEGTEEEVMKARTILEKHGTHQELNVH